MLIPVIAVLLASGLGITALLGGLDQVPDPPPEQLGEGAILDQGQFRTQFVAARYVFTPAANEFAEDQRHLELEFKVTNLGDRTTYVGSPQQPGKETTSSVLFAGSILRTTPPIRTEAGGVGAVLTGDELRSTQLHPGVATPVVVRYELDEATEVPDRIVLDMGTFELMGRFPSKVEDWSLATKRVNGKDVAEVAARVTLPVQQGERS
ncbi:hypothetical protein [Thermocatellispora tengchongensis]|uniref:hypothetical protein n=1 Tax=Thermocatellispora tengchongensis TaxID=1073253 RepID=UPI003377574D